MNKQDEDGRWNLEKSLNGKMWVDIEQRGEPSKWVTLRAVRVIKKTDEVYGSMEYFLDMFILPVC